MSYKFYEYKNCSTCRKAQKYLEKKNIDFKPIAIRETPPTKAELKKMLKYMDGDIKKLFNTSGQDYRAMSLKDKLPKLTEAQALELLSQNGNLVKRPFLIGSHWGTVGFKEDAWKKNL
ncbi:MAG: arsenate reductase family protein [Halobacteriovoraceae bacterium]|nr:arsenate reductase family protein [Halobacteriovoraceae bacterium]MCB9095269.1 arsenate reductase family protein [Halobacteriovoraceae bacterium]